MALYAQSMESTQTDTKIESSPIFTMSIRGDLGIRSSPHESDPTVANRLMQGQNETTFYPARLALQLGKQWGDYIRLDSASPKQWEIKLAGRLQHKSFYQSHTFLYPGVSDQQNLIIQQLSLTHRSQLHTHWELQSKVGLFVPQQTWYDTAAPLTHLYTHHPQWSHTRTHWDRSALGVAITLFTDSFVSKRKKEAPQAISASHQVIPSHSHSQKIESDSSAPNIVKYQTAQHMNIYQSNYRSQKQDVRRIGHHLTLNAFIPYNQIDGVDGYTLNLALNYHYVHSRFWLGIKGFYFQSLNPTLSPLYSPEINERLNDEYQALNFLTYLPSKEFNILGEALLYNSQWPLLYAWTLGFRSIANGDFASNIQTANQAQRLADSSFFLTGSLGDSLYSQQQITWKTSKYLHWRLAYQWYDLQLDFAYNTLHQLDLSWTANWLNEVSSQLVYRHAWHNPDQRWSWQSDEIFILFTWDRSFNW
jgi:hypothetical protein